MKPNYYFLSLVFLCLLSCDKDTDVLYLDPLHPDQELFRSSLFVEVVNSSGNPVANTVIRIGNYKRETDIRGFIYLKDILVGASTYLIAEKDGYFHASRRFYPTAGSAQYIKLILLNNNQDAFFSAGDGAVLPINGGITLHFPGDAYENQNGESYDGIVKVSAKAIPADDPDLSYKMPGDLTGVNVNGEPGSLASMGMVAVELQSSQGDVLRLKGGAQVKMELTIPAANLDQAPSAIPMWYFDEDEGIWKEEGSATLSGNVYVANVSHFSYWNYDAWFPAIKWGAIFDFGNRGFASQLEVCITIISMNTTKCAYTNSDGMVCGLVAANELLFMEVKNQCGDVIYSEQIGPFSVATMLGPITVPEPGLFITTVSGHAVTCDGGPVTNGYVTIRIGGLTQRTVLDDTSGAFSVAINACEESDVKIEVVDIKNNLLSLPLTFAYAPVVDADTITVCETSDEFIDIEVVGFPDHYYFYFPEMNIDVEYTLISADNGFSQGSQINFAFKGQTTGMKDVYWNTISLHSPGEGWFYVNDTLGLGSLTITQYGEVGEYIKGTLSTTCFHDVSGPGGGQEYPLIGSFAVLREE